MEITMNTVLTYIVICLSYFLTNTESTAHEKFIPIGAIFDWDDKLSKTGFVYSVAKYNSNVKDSYQLQALVESIDVKDSFSLATQFCKHLQNGVFMLFGSKVFQSREIIQSFTQRLHMPYLTTKIAETALKNGPYEIHLRPSVTEALSDVIKHFKWKQIHYVYDSDAGLVRLQELIKYLKDNDPPIIIKKMRRLRDVTNAHEELRYLDKSTGDEETKNILLDLDSESSYYTILRQIREVGMNKYGYKYLLATLDFINLDLEKFKHGGVNITGFQVLDNDSKMVKTFKTGWESLLSKIWYGAGSDRLQVDAALASDAVDVIVNAIDQMLANNTSILKTTFRRGDVYNYNRTRGIPCSENIPWMHGQELIKQIKQSELDGLTGKLIFNQTGFRTNYTLEVLSVGLNYGPFKQTSGIPMGTNCAPLLADLFLYSYDAEFMQNLVKSEEKTVAKSFNSTYRYIDDVLSLNNPKFGDYLGQWAPWKGFNISGDGGNVVETKITTKKIIVTSILEEPFLFDRNKGGVANYEGNDRYEGFCADLIKLVAAKCGFDYTIVPNKKSVYGTKISNNTWNGMIGELLEGNATIAVAPLTITKDREEVVDFSKPFMMSGVSIIIKKPDKQKPGVFSFMKPFSLTLWMCIVIGYIVVSIGMFLVSRFSPAEWKKVKIDEETEFSNKFSLASSLWFAMGSLMLQGSDTCPRSAAGRIIGGTWWFAVLIVISSYTANLAAFLTIEKMVTAIESADDLAKQTEISYGTLDSGSTQDFFKHSNVPTYQTMWNFMSTAHPGVFAKSVEEGVARVRSAKGKYAFFLESVYNEYINNQDPCDTMQVGAPLNLKGYGIASPKNSEWRDEISIAVLQLIEDGSLIKLKKTWWVDKGECGVPGSHGGSKKKSLSLSNVAGVFFILIGGLVLAIIVGVSDFLRSKSRSKLGGFALIGTNSAIPIMADQSDHSSVNGPKRENDFNEVKYFSYPLPPPKYSNVVDQNGHTDV